MNEETLEKAAKKIYLSYENNDLLYGHSEELQLAYKAGIVDGAKWQQEQDKNKYSEEEVIKLLIYCKDRFGDSELYHYSHDDEVKKWFEQVKKKVN